MFNKIPVVFHNGSNYDYHFIMRELANDFKGKFECLAENVKKYKAISALIKKIVNKEGNEDITTVSYKLKFINSVRFVASSL